jgi:hypothetical protein
MGAIFVGVQKINVKQSIVDLQSAVWSRNAKEKLVDDWLLQCLSIWKKATQFIPLGDYDKLDDFFFGLIKGLPCFGVHEDCIETMSSTKQWNTT